jgi:DNA-binding NtrC family response regulator
MTAYGSMSLAVEAVQAGAADVLAKPFEYSAMQDTIEKILRGRHVDSSTPEDKGLCIIGKSQKTMDIVDLAGKAAASDVTVLIEGEVGTGKEQFARIVHQDSQRRGRFMTLDCAASYESELERILFGSSTDPQSSLLSECNGGTLFIQDIDRFGPRLQSRLLRYLREGTFAAVDSAVYRKSDVRLIAATTRNLKALVSAGLFREDLYYLLNVMPVYVPSLRTRTADILPLVKHFLAKYKAKNGKNIKAIAPEVLAWMTNYDWPGNIQELENIIARACVLAAGEVLDESLIFTLPQDRPVEDDESGFLNITLKDNQRTLILKALKQNSGNFSRTATQLGISRTTLWRRLKKFKIEGLPVDQT